MRHHPGIQGAAGNDGVTTQGLSELGVPRPVSTDHAASRRRIGVIDIGSNSVRLVVFDGMERSPAYFYNEKVLCGLGAGLGETGRLSPDGWQSALRALRRRSIASA